MNLVEIIIPISRPDHLPALFAALEHQDCNPEQTSLLCYVDGDRSLFDQVQTFVDHAKFTTRRCIHRPINGKDPVKSTISERRRRIAAIHNELKNLVGECDYVLGLEDDTIPPANMVKRLLYDYAMYPYAGLIEGVELGRWGVTYVGAWRTNDPYEPARIENLLPPPDHEFPFEEIDGAGFYCFMTKRDFYVKHDFKSYGRDLMGPDFEFGLYLRQQGYKNYIDWSLNCKHMKRDGSFVSLANTVPSQVIMQKMILGKSERWTQKIVHGEALPI